MKTTLSLSLMTVVFWAACASPEPADKVRDANQEPPELSESLEEGVEVKNEDVVEDIVEDEDLVYASELDRYSIVADSVLVDETNIGFNYEADMTLDKDFSTAWCSQDSVDGEIRLSFNEVVLADGFGIVPGFGRDETIYFQNNRLMDIEIALVDLDGNEEVLGFNMEDKYGMHFVEFGDEYAFKTMILRIEDVHDGSKFDDTCIAEIDFWNDYVLERDASAALEYYENFKQDDALKPFDIVGKISLSDRAPDSCGNPGVGGDYVFDTDDGYVVMGAPVYFSAYVNEYGELGDEVDATLYWEDYWLNFDTGEETHYAWWVEKQLSDLKVEESCSGQKYLHFAFFDDGTQPFLDKFRVDLTKNGKLIARSYFRGTQ